MKNLSTALTLFIALASLLFLGTDSSRTDEPVRITIPGARLNSGLPFRTRSNVNNVSAWYDADGVQEINSATGNSGLIYPRGTAGAVFASGLLWSGEFNDGQVPVIRTNGHSYNTGMVAGAILGIRTGVTEDPEDPDVRIWRVRRDYATADLALDAAEINDVSPDAVTQGMIDAVRQQYETDWLEWPAHKGAPFYDSNDDGIYTPVISGGEPVPYPDADEPGMASGDQVIWYVCNDIGGSTPWGATPPAGLEQQGTIWAYNQEGVLEDIIFKRFRLIFKGTAATPDSATIENMYLCHWSDVDLGSFADDFAGSDTVLDLGFVYNGGPDDVQYSAFGLDPPSVGFDFFQGPIIPTGNMSDTAVFDLRKVSGAVNLPMTAFIVFSSGSIYSDPPFNYSGALQWNCMMQGRPPTPQPPPCPQPPTDPFTGQPAGPIWYYAGSDGISAPNPFVPNGWVDGMLEAPGDRRFTQSSGPFTMALEDTQEIVVGVVGGSGSDWLTNVSLMKSTSHNAQTMYDWLFTALPPVATVNVMFPNHLVASLLIRADGNPSDGASITATVRRQDHSAAAEVLLYDDGTHGDETAGDGIFTNSAIVGRTTAPHYLDVLVDDHAGRSIGWTRVLEGIATTGHVTISGEEIFSDNLNSDDVANPGENIRYGFSTLYEGISTLTDLRIAPTLEPDMKVRLFTSFDSGMIDSMVYDPGVPGSYFAVNIPEDAEGPYLIPVAITDFLHNEWRDTVTFIVDPFPDPVREAIVTHDNGNASGDFEIAVVDQSAINDHLYVIEGISEQGADPGITLRDSTDGRILFSNHPIPDQFGHNMPVTDGFKILPGTIDTTWGWGGWQVPQGTQVWTGTNSSYLQLEGFDGSMGAGSVGWFSGSTVMDHRLRDVLIMFAATDLEGNLLNPNDTTASFAYRYLENAEDPPFHPEFAPYILNPDTGIAYQNFQRTLPFAAYDVSSAPARRLAVGFMENNVNCGVVDGSYFPPVASGPCFLCSCNAVPTGAREFFFIFDEEYSLSPDPQFQVDIQATTLPLMWWGTPGRNGDVAFQEADQFLIEAGYPFTSDDRWTFNPTIVAGVSQGEHPVSFSLGNNYPNPFNPTTTILYQLPEMSRVQVKVYNLLGQEVRTLVNDTQPAGSYAVQWDARNNAGSRVATGVYFLRLEAGSPRGNGISFVESKKMLLLK